MDTLFFNLFNFSYRFLQRARKQHVQSEQHAQSKCTSKQCTQMKCTPKQYLQNFAVHIKLFGNVGILQKNAYKFGGAFRGAHMTHSVVLLS